MEKHFKSNKQGICPVCDCQGTLEYGEPVFDDYGLYFPWECLNCNSTGREMYSMEFDWHEDVYDENGVEVKND